MKTLRITLLALPLLLLLILPSCSQQDEIMEEMDSGLNVALDVNDPLAIQCCSQYTYPNGTNQCLVAFEFKSNVPDNNFPQGAYPVKLITGDCDCEWGANGIELIMSGGNTQQTAYTGGPAGGAPCNATPGFLASTLFSPSAFAGGWTVSGGTSGGNGGGGGTGGGTGGAGGTFGGWTQHVLDQRAQYADPNNAPIIGIMNWPASWNIAVTAAENEDRLTVSMGTAQQGSQLRRIGVFAGGNGTAVTYAAADGSKTYDIDMAGQPDGDYIIKLDFAPGFHLVGLINKVTPSPRK